MATSTLHERATKLYEADGGWREFAKEFDMEELAELEILCQLSPENMNGQAYDDEVYDALYFMKLSL